MTSSVDGSTPRLIISTWLSIFILFLSPRICLSSVTAQNSYQAAQNGHFTSVTQEVHYALLSCAIQSVKTNMSTYLINRVVYFQISLDKDKFHVKGMKSRLLTRKLGFVFLGQLF